MCGISGYVDVERVLENPRKTLEIMTGNLAHRGPDAYGYWYSDDLKIGLGHRRLSIIDLSVNGNQPMKSSSGRFLIVFNGEIYNYLILKQQLVNAGSRFYTDSDTEVILNAIEIWGINKTIESLAGMFAFCLYDLLEKKIYLARDRAGEKPLYYGVSKNILFFASELKAFNNINDIDKKINLRALKLFFTNSCVPAPYSIYDNIWKLMPGHYLMIDLTRKNPCDTKNIEIIKYWEYKLCGSNIEDLSSNLASLDKILNEVISQQMISDVTLGAFLSGGVDSSLITAIMQRHSATPIKTYAIGFEDPRFNEAQYASKVAKYLNTDHEEYIFTKKDVEDAAVSVPLMFDEPFGDSSQIPTHLVCKFARKHVTVALSGDGGDELFGGYNKYVLSNNILKRNRSSPPLLKNLYKLLIKGYLNNGYIKYQHNKFENFRNSLTVETAEDLYKYLSLNNLPDNFFYDTDPLPNQNILTNNVKCTIEEQLMIGDFNTYLPNDILAKVDRAAMSVSLETRAPFLDKRVIEFSESLPLEQKIKNRDKKHITKKLLSTYLPDELFDRPKKGFSVPLAQWFKNPKFKFIDENFNLYGPQDSFINYNIVKELLFKHRKGVADYSSLLWNIYVWYLWQNNQ